MKKTSRRYLVNRVKKLGLAFASLTAVGIIVVLSFLGSGCATVKSQGASQWKTPLPDNPYAQRALKKVGAIMAQPALNEAEAAQLQAAGMHGLRFAFWDIRMLAWAASQSESTYYQDETVIERAVGNMRQLYPQLRIFAEGEDKNLGKTLFRSAAYAGALAELFPVAGKRLSQEDRQACLSLLDKLLGEMRERWEGSGIFNMDMEYILLLAYSGQLLEQPELLGRAADYLRGIARQSLLPDGALRYNANQNAAFNYREADIVSLEEYYQATGDEFARELLKKQEIYYPLTVEPGNVAEYSTAPNWKHGWSSAAFLLGPEIIAAVTGNPVCRYIAQHELELLDDDAVGNVRDLVVAPIYRNDITPQPWPDHYIKVDRNIQGPRGRFGRWSFTGNARDIEEHDGSSLHQGKLTLVGAMIVDPPERPWPLNAALMTVYSQATPDPKYAFGGDYPYNKNAKATYDWLKLFKMTFNEKNAVVVAPGFTVLSSHHTLITDNYGQKKPPGAYETSPSPWYGNQLWLMTPERIVGVLEIRSTETTAVMSATDIIRRSNGYQNPGPSPEPDQAMAVSGRIRLLQTTGHPIVDKGDDNFEYGDMKIKIHEHNYPKLRLESSFTWRNQGPGRSGEIVLADDSVEIMDCTKFRRYFVVEIFPAWEEPAAAVQASTLPDGLLELRLDEGGNNILIGWFNPTDKSIAEEAPSHSLWYSQSPEELMQPAQAPVPISQNTVIVEPFSHIAWQAAKTGK